MNNISFLIGSGFSVPQGYPTTKTINQRLKKIDYTEICIHTSGDAWFISDPENPYPQWMKATERKFVQEFLEFYNSSILKQDEEFHYEKFYDFYISFLSTGNYTNDLSNFLESFIKKHQAETDKHDLIFQFNFTFNQLVANNLFKKFERVHLCKPYHPNHAAFLLLVENLAKSYIVNLHSLNHDLYIEHLASSDSIQAKLDDGFEELGSPYYGDTRDTYEKYMVRLPVFTNRFEHPFRLYKMHGSIDHYWYKDKEKLELLKLKRGVGKTDVFKEIESDGKL